MKSHVVGVSVTSLENHMNDRDHSPEKFFYMGTS